MNLRVTGALIGLLTLGGAAAGCSTLLEWDPDGLPCDDQGECVAGYSCLDDRCVLSGRTGACSDDTQCAEGSICAGDRCAAPCDAWFQEENECPSGHYCGEHPFEGGHRGHCVLGVSSEICTGVNDPCDNDDLRKYCVEISDDVFACMKSCNISWDTGTYQDTCGTDEQAETCQPLGKYGQLVCREERSTPGTAGDTCDILTRSCAPGLACLRGTCEVYCSSALEETSPGTSPCEGRRCCYEFKYGICKSECDG